MWARVVEVMLGCWLAISPLVFQQSEAPASLWWTDLSAAAAIIVFALASYWPPARYAHLGTIIVAGGLIAAGYFSVPDISSPVDQNHIVVGILLLMFAIVPNHASHPPEGWNSYHEPS